MSLRFLKPDQVAAVYFLGRRIDADIPIIGGWAAIGPGGWHVIPWLLFQVYVLNINTQRTLVPGKKEQIVRHDDDPLGPDQVRAFRVIQARKESAWFYKRKEDGSFDEKTMIPFHKLSDEERKALADDGLQSSIATEIIAYADWNIGWDKNGSLKQRAESLYAFIENIGDSMETAHDRIDGTQRSALQDLMSRTTLRHTLEVKTIIERNIKERLENLVGEEEGSPQTGPAGQPQEEESAGELEEEDAERPWGLNVSAVQIMELNPGRGISQALSDEASAIPIRNRDIENAKANKTRVDLETEAESNRIRKLGEADAAAFESKAKVLESEGGMRAAQLEVAKEVLGKGTVVVPGDPGGIISALTATASSVLKGTNSASGK